MAIRVGSKPRLLDLFCGAGGASMGYSRAGFDVVGVDLSPQPHYPFEFHQADALEVLRADPMVRTFAAIHASPPCQAYSSATSPEARVGHPDLYGETRALLIATGLPYVIENVIGAPYDHGVVLCGSMFGLEEDGEWVRRHRNFETSWLVLQPDHHHVHRGRPLLVTSRAFTKEVRDWKHSRQGPFALAERLMGIDWMTRRELGQAIPPAYTEWVGRQFINSMEVAA